MRDEGWGKTQYSRSIWDLTSLRPHPLPLIDREFYSLLLLCVVRGWSLGTIVEAGVSGAIESSNSN
jgi:hypothetical protein